MHIWTISSKSVFTMAHHQRNHLSSTSSKMPKDRLIEEDQQELLNDDNRTGNKKRGRGRPPKNMISRAYKPAAKNDMSPGAVQQNANDGFNVRKQPQSRNYMKETSSKERIKITGLFTDKNTNEIMYKVEENKTISYKPRKWVLNKDKGALIEFYETCVKIKA